MEIKLNHSEEELHRVFGISDERVEELKRNVFLINEVYEFSKKSTRLEQYYSASNNINEALYITFVTAVVLESARFAALQEKLKKALAKSNIHVIFEDEDLSDL